MLLRLTTLLLPLAILVSLPGCSDVKQQKAPQIPEETTGGDDGGDDMPAPEPDTLDVADEGPKETKAQKRLKCCQQCVAGLPDDKTGDPPGAIPCTKLTTKMDARCVVFFDKYPTTGKEAQECTEESADGGGEEGTDGNLD